MVAARSDMMIYVDRNGYKDTDHQSIASEASPSKIHERDLIAKSCFLPIDGQKVHAYNSSHSWSYLPKQEKSYVDRSNEEEIISWED